MRVVRLHKEVESRDCLDKYEAKIKAEFDAKIDEALQILTTFDQNSRWLKVKGDILRFTTYEGSKENFEQAEQDYKKALDLESHPMSPLRIEIAMNLGVLYFEVKKDIDSALAVGEDTLNEMLDAYLKAKE